MVGRQTSADDQVTISIYSSVVAECSSNKHLGVTISYNLNWSAHVTQLIKKASRCCGLLRCKSHHLPATISSLLYIYHVRPIFEYASPLWHGAISAELALSLEKLQASVAWAILRAPWRTPKQQLLKALNWPSLRWRRAIASTCLFQQLIHAPNTLPSLSKHLFPLLSSRSTRNRRKPFQIALPKVRTTRYQHSFSSILHCFGTASLSPYRLPSRHNNLELHLNNSGTNTNTIQPQIYLYHSELSTAHGDPPDQSTSALLGNPLYIK